LPTCGGEDYFKEGEMNLGVSGTEAFAAYVFAFFVAFLPLLLIGGVLAKSDADYLDLYHLDREKWEELRKKR